MFLKIFLSLVVTVVLGMNSSPAYAAKGHDDCNLCHKDAAARNFDLVTKAVIKQINPTTHKPYGKLDSLCVSCHTHNSKTSHPIGIVPDSRKVSVPQDALGFPGQEKVISCVSCHNPHPENSNYKYLRWAPENEYNLSRFCTNCHTTKGNNNQRLSMR